MKKKVIIKILIILLAVTSISTISYAGFSKVDREIPTNIFECLKIFFTYIVDSLFNSFLFLEYIHYGLFKIRLDYYIVAGVILLYEILNFLIIRRKKELTKLSLKIDIIILLILIVIATSLISVIDIYTDKLMIIITLILFITSLVFQKVISKKDDKIIKKYNRISKKIIIVLCIIEIIICIITYNYIFSTEKNIKNGEILVEIVKEYFSPWYETRYSKEIYMISTGESIKEITTNNKVLDIDKDGVLLEYIEIYYEKEAEEKDTEDSLKDVNSIFKILNSYKNVSEKKKTKLNWDTWYEFTKAQDPRIFQDGHTNIYIKLNNNTKGDK